MFVASSALNPQRVVSISVTAIATAVLLVSLFFATSATVSPMVDITSLI